MDGLTQPGRSSTTTQGMLFTQCKFLQMGNYLSPGFGPFQQGTRFFGLNSLQFYEWHLCDKSLWGIPQGCEGFG